MFPGVLLARVAAGGLRHGILEAERRNRVRRRGRGDDVVGGQAVAVSLARKLEVGLRIVACKGELHR